MMEREFVTIYYHNNKQYSMQHNGESVLYTKQAETLIGLHNRYDRSYRVWESTSPTKTELGIEFYNAPSDYPLNTNDQRTEKTARCSGGEKEGM